MPSTLPADPRFALAPWLAVRDHGNAADALRTLLRERLAGLAIRAHDGATAGGGNLVARLPGRSPSLRPVVLLARTDLLDPSALAALAAAVAVPSLLADAHLDRDVIVVLADDASPPDDAASSHRVGRARAAPVPPRRPGARAWFEHQRQHDVKAAVVLDPLQPARWTPPGVDLLRVHGIETDARMPGVVDGAAPHGCHLVLVRHGDDALPFAAHALPYLVVGGAILAAATGDAAPPAALGAAARSDAATPTQADFGRLAAHAARLAATLLARLDAARLPGPFNGYDSTDHELAAYGAGLGEALGDPPRTREDLERRIRQIWG